MAEETPLPKEVEEFLRDQIDTIPHLEALLLAFNNQSRRWTVEEMAAELYVESSTAQNILQNLVRRGLLIASAESPERYTYKSISAERDNLIASVENVYRKHLIRISRMIHSKAAPGVREFAEAFRFKKDRE